MLFPLMTNASFFSSLSNSTSAHNQQTFICKEAFKSALSSHTPRIIYRASKPLHSSERFYPLEWNEWNVAFII